MNYSEFEDEHLIRLLTVKEDREAFKAIYERYWKEVFLIAFKKVGSKEIAEELCQNLFMSLWERRNQVQIEKLSHWLFRSVKYGVINYYKSQKVREKYQAYAEGHIKAHESTTDHLTMIGELNTKLDKGIATLPDKTRKVFLLSRLENKSIRDIAVHMKMSEKAVEYHITQSLKKLRVVLKDYLGVIIWLLFPLIS